MNNYFENRLERCTFCSSGTKIYIGHDNLASLNLSNKKLAITHFKKKNTLIGCLDIEYCPMCGRSLDELKTKKRNL